MIDKNQIRDLHHIDNIEVVRCVHRYVQTGYDPSSGDLMITLRQQVNRLLGDIIASIQSIL